MYSIGVGVSIAVVIIQYIYMCMIFLVMSFPTWWGHISRFESTMSGQPRGLYFGTRGKR